MLIVRFIEKVCDIHKIRELLSAKEKSNFRITRFVNVIFKNILNILFQSSVAVNHWSQSVSVKLSLG